MTIKTRKFIFILPISLIILLIVFLAWRYYGRTSPYEQQKEEHPAQVLIHRSDDSLTIINPSDPNYQNIVAKTNKIINNSILIPREKQNLLTLVVDPAAFPGQMKESDYIEIQPKQPLKVEGQTAEYDKLRFVLSGGYEGIIFLHTALPHDYWGAWSPSGGKEFWSLREFVGLPIPTVQTTSPIQHQITSPLSREANNEETLQKLGIKITEFYKEFTAKPNTFHPAQLAITTEACTKGGYDLSAHLDKTLTFTGYRSDVTYENEPLNVWVVSSDSKIVCIYLSVRESSNMAPGIFSVNNPLLSFPSR